MVVELRIAFEKLFDLPGREPRWLGVDTSSNRYKRFLSFGEDDTVRQIEQAMADGFDQPELVKRYTAAGTRPSQSHLTGHNLPVLVAEKKRLKPGDLNPTTVRPPAVPTSLAVLGGRQYPPVKRTPLHEKQKAMGTARIPPCRGLGACRTLRRREG